MINTHIENNVLTIQLNRPEAMNALSDALLKAVAEALLDAKENADIGAVVITGNEKAFAAGADISVMAGMDAAGMKSENLLQAEMDEISNFPKPMIAAVTGYALGGGFELALACDIIVVAPDATLGLPEINLGIIPGMGGTQRLIRAVGKSKASEMIMTGNFISGEDAYRLGIASQVVDVSETLIQAQTLATKIARKPRLALKAAKQALSDAQDLGLGAGLKAENNLFFDLFDTHDQKEGMAAFLEKRKPNFENR